MNRVKYLICTAIILGLTACMDFENETKDLNELDEIKNTVWYSYDVAQSVYYDIEYSDIADSENSDWFEGKMLAYDSYERVNIIEDLCRDFTYNFTKATADTRAIVKTRFSDGKFYDGFVIPKGFMQISSKDVYIIQLYEVDEKGNLILTEEENYQSTLMMWKE